LKQENLLDKIYGRIREIAEASDGSIGFRPPIVTDAVSAAKEGDRILRLVPVK